MLEYIYCWLFGHKPEDVMMEVEIEDLERFNICKCIRCKRHITFKPGIGWVTW
jgi:hypothetical protein